MSTVNIPNPQAFPWREFALKKMRDAQEKLVKEGGTGDMGEQRRLDNIQMKENWDRTRALLSSARQHEHKPFILSFHPPVADSPKLQPAFPATVMTLGEANMFDLESSTTATGPTGRIVVELGRAIE